MNSHKEIRELLLLAAAGVLEAGEDRSLRDHLAQCEACTRELRLLEAVSMELRLLPAPAAPAWLAERTCQRVREALEARAESRWDEAVVLFSMLLAWTFSLTLWFLYKLFTGGSTALLSPGFTQVLSYLAASTLLAWLTAGAAVVAVGRYAPRKRSFS